ncbi:MAG: DUF721 domain-containing protein [Legionellales bacterium]|nr:DUF721 domain-containing protein [Legionellales bacterium]
MKTKKTLDYLQSHENNALSVLINKVGKIAELDKAVKNNLSSPLCDHCRVANLRQGRLILQADSPVWGSKLRFESSSLLSKLRQEPLFAGLVGIDFFVAPFSPSFNASVARPKIEPHINPLSAKNRQLLRETADKITDPKLQAVLRAIAARKTQ